MLHEHRVLTTHADHPHGVPVRPPRPHAGCCSSTAGTSSTASSPSPRRGVRPHALRPRRRRRRRARRRSTASPRRRSGYRRDDALAIAHRHTLAHTVAVNDLFAHLVHHAATAPPTATARTGAGPVWSALVVRDPLPPPRRRPTSAPTPTAASASPPHPASRRGRVGVRVVPRTRLRHRTLAPSPRKLDGYAHLAAATRTATPVLIWLPTTAPRSPRPPPPRPRPAPPRPARARPGRHLRPPTITATPTHHADTARAVGPSRAGVAARRPRPTAHGRTSTSPAGTAARPASPGWPHSGRPPTRPHRWLDQADGRTAGVELPRRPDPARARRLQPRRHATAPAADCNRAPAASTSGRRQARRDPRRRSPRRRAARRPGHRRRCRSSPAPRHTGAERPVRAERGRAADIPPDYLLLYQPAAADLPRAWTGPCSPPSGRSSPTTAAARSPASPSGAKHCRRAAGRCSSSPPTFAAVARPAPTTARRRDTRPRGTTRTTPSTPPPPTSATPAPPPTSTGALFAYNHSDAYVTAVLAQAAAYRATRSRAPHRRPQRRPRHAAGSRWPSPARQLGLPYLWGGDGPAHGDPGFDCSGLTTAAYAAAGITLPRTAHTQYLAGPSLPPGTPLQAGDLLFFGTPTRVHHVGIATGDGTLMIHAPRRGTTIRIQDAATLPDYLAASRPAR